MTSVAFPVEGGCACRAIRYRMLTAPMTVHCCHCRWCQRETGASFALNAVIETERVELVQGQPELVNTPTHSGKGQKVWRCPACRIALWSHYAGGGETVRFVRVGTLDSPDAFPPDIHVFTASKQPWVQIPAGHKAFAEFYNAKEVWPPEAQARWKATRGK